jgi:cell division septation protein DedD
MDQLTGQVKGFQEVQTQLKGQTNTKDQKEAYMKKIPLILICMLLMGCIRVYYNIAPEFRSDGIVNVDGRMDADDPRVTVSVDDVTVDWKELKSLIEKQMANLPKEPKPTKEPAAAPTLASVTAAPLAADLAVAEPVSVVADSAARMTHSVQVGAFRQLENAEQEMARLTTKGYPARLVPFTDSRKRTWYTVRIGDYPDLESARAKAVEFTHRESMQSVVRPYGNL